jgi:hypothetical protein
MVAPTKFRKYRRAVSIVAAKKLRHCTGEGSRMAPINVRRCARGMSRVAAKKLHQCGGGL